MDYSEQLIKDLKLNSEKPSFNRKYKFRVYPFFTRNPERAKFTNGFAPILGVIGRNSLNLKMDYGIDDYNLDKIIEKVEVKDINDETQSEMFLRRLFDYNHLDSFKHPYLLNYKTLSDGTERRGEIDIGEFISEFFNLKNDYSWQEFIGDKTSKNLVEEILLTSIEKLEEKEVISDFKIFNSELYNYRNEDLKFLLSHKDFALKYLELFFAFYYFQYITQTALYLDRINDNMSNELYKNYFTLETEKITATRETNKHGFNQIREIRNFTVVNEVLMGYINYLTDDEEVYSLREILRFDNTSKHRINNHLVKVLEKYKNLTEKVEPIGLTLDENIFLFKKWLSEDMSNEIKSRFYLSIEEVGNLYFLKSRGRLGKVLTLRKDMIILLTAIVVKNQKMIIKDVFLEFEKRGVYLDRYSKEEVLKLYEKMNILDKKSDSGEAKYVKPIL